MAAARDVPSNNPHLIDELEAAFQNCISGLTTQEYFNVQDSDEIKAGMEQSLNKFLEVARQTESFFLQKRLILSKQKPEQFIKDETEELRAELERKDSIIKKHQERLHNWQNLLNSINKGQSGNPSQAPIPQQMPGPLGPQYQPHPMNSQQGQYPHGGAMPGQTQMGLPNTMTAIGQGQGHYPQSAQMQQPPPPNPHMMMARQGSGHSMGPHQPPPAYPQGPLQFLEQSMSNIGMPRT